MFTVNTELLHAIAKKINDAIPLKQKIHFKGWLGRLVQQLCNITIHRPKEYILRPGSGGARL